MTRKKPKRPPMTGIPIDDPGCSFGEGESMKEGAARGVVVSPKEFAMIDSVKALDSEKALDEQNDREEELEIVAVGGSSAK
jgi:hypothetical protein